MAGSNPTDAAVSQPAGGQVPSAVAAAAIPSAVSATAPATAPSMDAPSIPNLLSRLGPPRSGRGGRRGGIRGIRGGPLHGRVGRGGFGSFVHPRSDHNTVIQNTDTDAALSRLSAVDIGLLEDPFAKFLAGGDGGPAPRRLPIINRGTYTRTQALDAIIRTFLSEYSPTPKDNAPTRQVVSLGAGTDTRSFRFLAQEPTFQNVAYHEIDFPAICSKKRSIIQSVPYLQSFLASPIVSDPDSATTPAGDGSSPIVAYTSWHANLGHGNQLWSHGVDLRDIAAAADKKGGEDDKDVLRLNGLCTDIPTLLVSECCLCYLQPTQTASVLRFFSDKISPSLGVVIYEPISPGDAFGRTMVSNLAARGIEMPTLETYPDGAAQEARLKGEAGLTQAHHLTIANIWDAWVPEAEKERINQLDGLDEVEEWDLLASHYVVAWGSRGDHFASAWSKLYES